MTLGEIRSKVDSAYMRWARSPAWRFVHRSWFAQFTLMAVTFALLHKAFYKFVRLKENAYQGSLLFDGVFTKAGLAVLIILIAAFLLLFQRRTRWRSLGGKPVRILIPVVMAVSIWGIAFTGFNYFTNEAYILDRLLIVALFALTIRWAGLSPILLMYLLLFQGQQRLSAGDLELTDKFPLLDAQVAFIAWLLLRTILPLRLRAFVWFLVALQAINYFVPGLAKLFIGDEFSLMFWFRDNPVHALIATGQAHGWFYWMNKETVEWFAGTAAYLTPIMAAFTMGVEVGAAILPLWRRTAPWLLFAAILMHLGIMSLTGIFFWKWIVLDILLIWCIRRTRRTPTKQRNWARVAALALLIACFPLYATPKWLGWIDTRMSEQYFIEVETRDEGGLHEYRIQQGDMSPFDITFEQGDFHYANPKPVLTNTWGGVKDFDLGYELNRTLSPDELTALVEARGVIQFEEKKATELDRFLRTYFTHVNARDGEMRWMNWIGPPTHVQVRSGGERFDFKSHVVKVKLRFVRKYFDGERIHELDNYIVREVEIPD